MALMEAVQRPPIYLDYNATTPIGPAARSAMLHHLNQGFPHGNPSSAHVFGKEAKKLVDDARDAVAGCLGCKAAEVVFTSGGTESNNYAIIGAALQYREADSTRTEIITSTVEHPSVRCTCDYLRDVHHFTIVDIPVDSTGRLDMQEFAAKLSNKTVLVTIMHANNETGSVQPIAEIARMAKAQKVPAVHTDAAQTIGKLPTDVNTLGVDLLTVCSHKFYGPKGVGALYIRAGIVLKKFMHGGSHERNLRAGTENVLELVGLAAAASDAAANLESNAALMRRLRDRLHQNLKDRLGDANVVLNGNPDERLPNTLNVSLRQKGRTEFAIAGLVLQKIDGVVAASGGSACHSDSASLSPVLTAMRLPHNQLVGALRLSTGCMLSEAEVDTAAEALVNAVNSLD
eukprot:NODE_698_length_1410_cov_203.739162_g528_i0.p1 GENE.NODE_698_length_1410_cov_203.739162_g528_i0~~NODE_698_length_1410_cov_203.739162_g528_i0.p1  ORF type:complete len:401 (+),score=106.14 NODE_698_length_1410_cov_203.739162_g528_i0:64-1266(+)